MARMLVIYYSWSNGNTEGVAKTLAAATGADLARIETQEPYPSDYDMTVEQAHVEVKEGFMPDIVPLDVDVDSYDIVAVGTPTWWYTMAPAVRTFLSEEDWAGKVVVPFMTNAGWPGTVISDMEDLCDGADVVEPLEVTFDSNGGDHMETGVAEVKAWSARVAALLGEKGE